MGAADVQMKAMILQTIIYFFLSCAAIYAENWFIRHKESLLEKRSRLEKRIGIDRAEDAKIIAGK